MFARKHFHALQRLLANVVLDAFGVAVGGLVGNAERLEKRQNDLVAPAALGGESLAAGREADRPVPACGFCRSSQFTTRMRIGAAPLTKDCLGAS